jgi:hypothetical protein
MKVITIFNLFKKKRKKKGYLIHNTETNHILCRIINEYNTESEADTALVNLLTHKVTEEKLLDEFEKKLTW